VRAVTVYAVAKSAEEAEAAFTPKYGLFGQGNIFIHRGAARSTRAELARLNPGTFRVYPVRVTIDASPEAPWKL
jgi:hypothetical protein